MFVGVAVGLGLGGEAGWLLGVRARAGLQVEAAAARTRADEMLKRVEQLDTVDVVRDRELTDARNRVNDISAGLAWVTAELDTARRSASDRVRLLERAEHILREAFALVSTDALRANNQFFLQLAQTSRREFQKQATVDLDQQPRTGAPNTSRAWRLG